MLKTNSENDNEIIETLKFFKEILLKCQNLDQNTIENIFIFVF